ncbi:discoidin domain-containing protein [Paenibacillus aurantius]|uniref:Discoidin domain-containing protein n=1 Tax=Paenibacillus aurantius TaxID=2918900 RepID=A0AA96LBH0_9BACL|nr:discoidin domain-containing protein [Paenibacillus aurantius]WNQ09230.1 discoidin domain-containing protein [Paenibacillus aurantius]
MLGVSALLSASLFLPGTTLAATPYDNAVLADHPVGYWPIAPGATTDLTGHGLNGSFTGTPSSTIMPNGDTAPVFNGINQYFTIPDHPYLEVTRTGVLTIEAWIRPDVLQFAHSEGSGYVHWMGKGEAGQHSWVARMYNYTNSENRPNRISGYSFNLTGGLGAGSYFQDPVTVGEWIHYALVINTVNTSSSYTTGYTKIYKNGVLRDQDRLSDYNIIPGDGTAPMRIGTRDLASFFQGAIGKVAVYDYEVTPTQLAAHGNVMNATRLTTPSTNVTASSDDGNVPANTLDGSLATRWSANGDGQWIQWDLGASKTVDHVKVAWYNGDARTASFDIKVSNDGTTWTSVYSGASSGTTLGLEAYDLANPSARYVRIIGHGNSINLWNSITETEIWGY